MTDKPRVALVGGGFAGQHAFRALIDAGFPVTLVDSHPYATFQPLLYQVATGGLNPGDVTYSLRQFTTHRSGLGQFRRTLVLGIDHDQRQLHVAHGKPIGYDRLILCQGVGPGFFGVPGAEEHARTIYTRAEAQQVRDLIFSGLESLTVTPEAQRVFTVVVVGGGPTGIETAGTLAELKSEAIPVVYPELSTDNFRVVLVEMSPQLLSSFDRRLQVYGLRQLKKRGVDVRLSTAVARIDGSAVELADGSTLPADVVIWASGVTARPEVADWGVPTGRGGRILVDSTLRVRGLDGVYAAGDAALDPDHPLPQLAQPAIQMGRHAAQQIIAEYEGRALEPFVYHDRGTMAAIGRYAAVVEFPGGRTVTGLPAWALWVGVHMATLLGGRNRIQAMVNNAVRYLSWPRSATTIVGDVVTPESTTQKDTDR